MTSFADLVADVYTTTNRPDLVAETALAVRKATMKLHTTGWDLETNKPKVVFYWPDRAEAILIPTQLDATGTNYAIDTTAAPIFRFRGLSYLRQYTSPGLVTDLFFEPVDYDRLFDQYYVEKTNKYYMIGSTINIKFNGGVQFQNVNQNIVAPPVPNLGQVRVGYYQYPVCISAGYKSWIADQLPDMIVEEASGMIFKMIGKDDEYQKYQALFVENSGMLEGQFTTQNVRT